MPGVYIPPHHPDESQGKQTTMGIWWPAADSAKLRTAAQAWREMARALDAVDASSQSAVLNMLADNQGPAIDAFTAYWGKWSGGSRYLQTCSQACTAMARALDEYAQAVDTARVKVEQLVAEVATAVVLGVVLGVCTVGIATAAAGGVTAGLIASAEAVGITLSWTAASIVSGVLVGATFGAVEAMAIDIVAIQPEKILLFHDQKDFNWNEVWQWGEMGAAGGFVGGGLGAGVSAVRRGWAAAGDGVGAAGDGVSGAADGIPVRLRPPDEAITPPPPAAADGDGNFAVGIHKDWPSPRPTGMQSHHGVMSAWADKNVPGYVADNAPTVLMPEEAHDMTRFGFQLWRVEMRAQLGGTFDWTKITETQARDLAEHLFNGADVPPAIRAQYWTMFDAHLSKLMAAAS